MSSWKCKCRWWLLQSAELGVRGGFSHTGVISGLLKGAEIAKEASMIWKMVDGTALGNVYI